MIMINVDYPEGEAHVEFDPALLTYEAIVPAARELGCEAGF